MISKKQLLEDEKHRKEKLYGGNTGRRDVNSLKGKTALILVGVVFLLIALAFIYYANNVIPSQKQTSEQIVEEEVAITEETKIEPTKAVVEEKKEKPSTIKPTTPEVVQKPVKEEPVKEEEVKLTFYDNLSKPTNPLESEESTKPDAVAEAAKEEKAIIKAEAVVKEKPQRKVKEVKEIVGQAEGDYRIQFASYRNKSEAENKALEIQKKNFTAYVEEADLLSKGIWYRVYIGNYTTSADAKTIKKQLETTFNVKPFIVRKK